MHRRPGVAVVVALAASVALTGCTSEAADVAGTPAASAGPTGSPAPGVVGRQTLWTLEATGEQLPDDDPDVQAVRTLVTVHSGAIDNRAPDTLARALDDEFAAYSPEFAATLDGVGWRETSTARTTGQGVATEQVGLGWMRSSIAADRTSATARYESFVVFTAASEAFLAESGIELGRRYVVAREVTAASSDGVWLVTGVRETPLRPQGADG